MSHFITLIFAIFEGAFNQPNIGFMKFDKTVSAVEKRVHRTDIFISAAQEYRHKELLFDAKNYSILLQVMSFE